MTKIKTKIIIWLLALFSWLNLVSADTAQMEVIGEYIFSTTWETTKLFNDFVVDDMESTNFTILWKNNVYNLDYSWPTTTRITDRFWFDVKDWFYLESTDSDYFVTYNNWERGLFKIINHENFEYSQVWIFNNSFDSIIYFNDKYYYSWWPNIREIWSTTTLFSEYWDNKSYWWTMTALWENIILIYKTNTPWNQVYKIAKINASWEKIEEKDLPMSCDWVTSSWKYLVCETASSTQGDLYEINSDLSTTFLYRAQNYYANEHYFYTKKGYVYIVTVAVNNSTRTNIVRKLKNKNYSPNIPEETPETPINTDSLVEKYQKATAWIYLNWYLFLYEDWKILLWPTQEQLDNFTCSWPYMKKEWELAVCLDEYLVKTRVGEIVWEIEKYPDSFFFFQAPTSIIWFNGRVVATWNSAWEWTQMARYVEINSYFVKNAIRQVNDSNYIYYWYKLFNEWVYQNVSNNEEYASLCGQSFPVMSLDKKYFACFDSYLTNFNTDTDKIMECWNDEKWKMIVNDSWNQIYFECESWEIELVNNSLFNINLDNIFFTTWKLPPIQENEQEPWTCKMFSDDLSFIYYSDWSKLTFSFSFPQTDIPILWQVAWWVDKIWDILIAPLNSIWTIVWVLTPVTATQKDYCLFGYVVTFKSHYFFKNWKYYWKMTLIDYFAIFAWWIFLGSSLLAYRWYRGPYEWNATWYEEDKYVNRNVSNGGKMTTTRTVVVQRKLKNPK